MSDKLTREREKWSQECREEKKEEQEQEQEQEQKKKKKKKKKKKARRGKPAIVPVRT
jgi:hypothetical protein